MKGLFGKQILTANTPVEVYRVSDSAAFSEVDINILNPTATDAVVSVAFSTEMTTPNPEDFVEQGLVLTGDGSVLARSKEILSAGERIYVASTISGVTVRVSGIERI